MSEARTRVVLENYPAEKLPDDMRGDFSADDAVQITIEKQPEKNVWDDFLERVRSYHEANPGKSVTSEEAVARVRAIRDEWD
ncbi:hypothetical protein [Aureimonas psammosilenae]|uniref:hypothetical protein n=1 Tax=Aureimonas psammosilenae TaxID=2495496 RepID=UPI0012604244|nr:hypothetical protein [Aureimonas psammosilenae]